MFSLLRVYSSLIVAAAALSACSHQPAAPTVSDAVVRLPAVAGNPGVAYLAVHAGSGAARRLTAISVKGANRVELHESKMDGGMMTMTPVADLPLPPGSTVTLAPGGTHAMLFGLDPALKSGATTEVTVTLDDGTHITATAPVKAAGE